MVEKFVLSSNGLNGFGITLRQGEPHDREG
jgi:hypothetical protein